MRRKNRCFYGDYFGVLTLLKKFLNLLNNKLSSDYRHIIQSLQNGNGVHGQATSIPTSANSKKDSAGCKEQQEFARKFVTYLDELWEYVYRCKPERNV